MPSAPPNGSPNGSPNEPAVVDFQRDVLAPSRERPVLVDFWAAWCGPCRVLGPVLEKLANEAASGPNGPAWTLVKVDTEANRALAQQAGIRGIPAVKLYVDGEVEAEFTGALPEPLLRRWLDEHLPSPQKERLARARRHLAAGDPDAARPLLEAAVQEEPQHEEARTLLARTLALSEPDRATDLVGTLPGPEADAVRTLARLHRLPDEPDALPETPVQAPYLAAAEAVRAGDVDAALEGFIAVLQRDRAYDDDGARKAAVALFVVLGEAHPAVQRHRPVFNRSLY